MQGGSTGIVYGGLKYQARCITDVRANSDHTSFLAGTLYLKEENEVHLIRLSSSGTELVCEGLFYHSYEIWDLKSCPFDQRIFSTVFTNGETHGAAIWEIPELYGQTNALEQLVSLNKHAFKVKCILWWPVGKHDKLISIDEGNLFLWSIDSSNKTAKGRSRLFEVLLRLRIFLSMEESEAIIEVRVSSMEVGESMVTEVRRWRAIAAWSQSKVISQESIGMLHNLSGGAWDPHDQNVVAAICDSSLQCWDLRSMKKSNSIEHAHVRDVDYNPKKQHILVTAEDESGLRIWDLRMAKLPVEELPGHAHWTWSVRHNPEYDQLILSAGTDSAVNLWMATSIGNNDSTPESLVDSPMQQIDPLLNSYNDYEDSVYGVAWSSRDPTIFASLSYDGRVVVESVKQYLKKK